MTARPPAAKYRIRRAPAGTEPDHSGTTLGVRCQIHLIGGQAGRTLAVAQGRALAALLASLGEVEVGQGEEVSP
jgi:hypothetical protein